MAALLAALLLASPPHPNKLIDGGLTLGAGLSWLALNAAHADWVTTDCPCHADQVNTLDRSAITAPFAVLLLISPDAQPKGQRRWLGGRTPTCISRIMTR